MSRRRRKGGAIGECGRSGQKMLLSEMVEDGYYPGLMVHPTWYEPRHPQEEFRAIHDEPSLKRPMPENNSLNLTVTWPVLDEDTQETVPVVFGHFALGNVAVVIT